MTVGSDPATLTPATTSPAAGATVSGTVWVDVRVEGASGTSNTFILTVDGHTLATQTVSGVNATLAWNSRNFANGAHALAATVRDAAGTIGSANRSINVKN